MPRKLQKRSGRIKAKTVYPKSQTKKLYKPPTIKQLEKKLRAILYPLIKKRDGDTCFVCGKTDLKGATWHAGHYCKAELCNLVYRYDERMIHSQCSYCNLWLRGNTIEYRKRLIEEFGEEYTLELENEYNKKLPISFDSRTYLEGLIEKYKGVESL